MVKLEYRLFLKEQKMEQKVFFSVFMLIVQCDSTLSNMFGLIFL